MVTGSFSDRLKIIVVDDSRIYQRLVETTLAGQPYTLLFAKNGREALALFAEHRPALIITDWEMPDITGPELCSEVRKEQNSYTYLILLTSNTEKDKIVKGLAAGADDYLTKPFDSGELLARVSVGCRVAELHRDLRAKNRLLEELALADSLTGIPNRRAFEGWAERELNAAARHQFAFWIVMADLDHFKEINDKYGHAAGDAVLKRIAALLRTNTRASNMCARFGGEEFVLGLTHVDGVGVQIAVERIRRQFEAETFSFSGKAVLVTASFGVAGSLTNGSTDLQQLIQEADAALYTAKRTGRNRIEFAP